MVRNILVVAGFLFTNTVLAQDTATAVKSVAGKKISYNDIINGKTISKSGLFKVHKVDEKYYFEIPDSLLKREIILTTRLSKVPTGSPRYGGEIVNSIIVAFEKASDEKLFLRVITNVAMADSTNAIAKAVRNSTIDPIVMVMDIKSRDKGNQGSLVDFTDFVLKDNNMTGFSAASKKTMSVGGAAADRSYILSVTPFPDNIEIKTMKTYSVGGGAPAPGAPAETSSSVGVTMELSTSMMLLPVQPMSARHADPRVGYHTENYKIFADDQQKVEEKNFIIRQRLEPKSADIEKYNRGELVEPREPLVYYVDPATPKQWRSYIIAGINDWNEAFAAAGFKNAIIGKEWPENDSTMSIEDARYKVIRYFPSGQPFSYSPRVHDPRSGEILQTYIGWSHSKLQSLHDWYFVQAAATDPRARTMKFSTELMGSLIRAAIAREVGASLGLRTNLAASNAVPVEKLRDKEWLKNNAISASVMDNIHYNYVAQPGDGLSPEHLLPRIGAYDKWAIKYGYTFTGKLEFSEEKNNVSKWILDALAANPGVEFGAEPTGNVNVNDPMDPASQSEDLGNDRVKASEYGLKNLRIVMKNLLEWTREDMDMYDNAAAMYDNICDWYGMLNLHVYAELGGVHENLKSVEQSGDIYVPVSREAQKRAMKYLHKEVFQTPVWLLDKEVLNKFGKPAKKEKVQRMQENALYYVLSPARFYRMTTETMRFGKEKTYTIDELLTDLNNGLWSELKGPRPLTIDPYRRVLQKACIENLNRVLKESSKTPDIGSASPDLSITDIPVVVRVHLKKIMDNCNAAIPVCTDAMTLAHLKYVSQKINHLLNPKN